MADRLARNEGTDKAVWKLAERLWLAMERLEPSLEKNMDSFHPNPSGVHETGATPHQARLAKCMMLIGGAAPTGNPKKPLRSIEFPC